MSDSATFLDRVIAARRAAWIVFLVAVGVQIFTYLAFLGMERGWMDGLIESGLYGDTTPGEATRLIFLYTIALKLMATAILMGALFLTLWVRGLRRIG